MEAHLNRPPDKLQTLRRKRDRLYEDARAHPDSEADEMVRMLLLAGISSIEPEIASEEAEADRAEERRRFRSARKVRANKPGAGASAGPALAETEQVGFETRERQSKLRRVAEATREAQAAAAAGRPLDPVQVYSRIAEIIGLQPPARDADSPPERTKPEPE